MATLSELVAMMERGTVPLWLRDEVYANRVAIADVLLGGMPYTITGPKGEHVTITREKPEPWIDRHYRSIMLIGMLIEIILIAVLVVQGIH